MKFTVFAGLAFGLIIAAGTLPAIAYTGQQFEKNVAIKMNQARQIALTAHPGKVTDEELEKERGGSGLRYSFDIKNGRKKYEVGVDAQTGKVLENKAEGPNPD